MNLDTDIKLLNGVGEKRALLYKKLDIKTIGDLLYFFPRTYLDLSNPVLIEEAAASDAVVICARVESKAAEQRIRKGLSLFKVRVCDASGSIILTFYNTKYTVDSLKTEEEYLFYGRTSGFGSRKEMQSPMVFPCPPPSGFIPVYSLTQGISSKMIHSNAIQALSLLDEDIPDPIPAIIRKTYGLCHLHYALTSIHLPQDAAAIELARSRLIFEELFTLSLSLAAVKNKTTSHTGYICQEKDFSPFTVSLPFTLTGAQQRAIGEVLADMQLSVPMNRLVQGDVGSGKTMVAAGACFLAAQNGFQSAMMAPTEILARQHYNSLSALLEPLGLSLALLTGSLSAKEKRAVKERVASGEAALCVGTHALISEDVAFQKLALVITDEQHRFGVTQRTRLAEKSDHPHTLVMSATPIPRTLALMVYGDLDVSVIDELPPNRKPVQTFVINSSKKQRAYNFVKDHLDRGLQAYIVCPLVEAGEVDTGLANTEEYADNLAKGVFSSYKVGVLHGKMKAKEKDAVMAAFQSGEIELLVATTVIEVGVDVPNAVIMMIENAERFGLSQLHQLRGRVGRGSEKSTCILISDARGEEIRQRLNLLHETSDGFKVAEYDLKTRGPGDFLGKRQHGLPQLKLADLSSNMDVLLQAQEAAHYAFAHKEDFTPEERRLLNRSILRVLHSVGAHLN